MRCLGQKCRIFTRLLRGRFRSCTEEAVYGLDKPVGVERLDDVVARAELDRPHDLLALAVGELAPDATPNVILRKH